MADQPPKVLPQEASTTIPPAEATIEPTKPKSIALIICSTRLVRINPAVSRYVESILPTSSPYAITSIDLKTVNLPFFNDSTVPAALDKTNPTPGYATAHARAWSAEISKHSAFIWVSPQYNWSMTASAKNAIDYLFHEWGGKPTFAVSYGARGGGKGRAALENVLTGVKAKVVVPGVEITIPLSEGAALAEREGEGEEAKDVSAEMRATFKEQGVEEGLARAWGELVKMLEG